MKSHCDKFHPEASAHGEEAGLPDFSLYQIPEWGKIDEMTTKHNKWH
jgi:hypothetical protein